VNCSALKQRIILEACFTHMAPDWVIRRRLLHLGSFAVRAWTNSSLCRQSQLHHRYALQRCCGHYPGILAQPFCRLHARWI
jgi:hypothetical protein